MREETKELIKEIARFIDRYKYNPILLAEDYDEYLEKVLTELVIVAINFEKEQEEIDYKRFDNPKDALNYLKTKANEGEKIILDEKANHLHSRKIQIFVKSKSNEGDKK